jgi:DASS family divalent anion:Na+ symporter
MVGTFFLLLTLWIFADFFAIKPAITALIGISILLVTEVLSWKDILKEESAFDTFFWFATLLTLAGNLNKLGLTTWFSSLVTSQITGFSWMAALVIIALIYLYIHYFFASTVAHIGAFYAAFLAVALSLGAPPLMAALLLAFFSNLDGGLTHYASGPAPIYYGSQYVPIKHWWKTGFFVSLLNVTIFLVVGALWWKVIGLW